MDVILPSKGYRERLLSHYKTVKEAVADPDDPIHRVAAEYSHAPATGGDVDKPPLKLSRAGRKPPPPRSGTRKWR
jgi:hypothetical protein